MIRAHVLICGGTGCTSSGSVAIQKKFEDKKAEEERQRAEYEAWQKKREEELKLAEIRRQKEEAEHIKILEDIKIVDISENDKYILTGPMICGCGKDNDIEEVKKDGYAKEESAIIKREIYFTNEENYNFIVSNSTCELLIAARQWRERY